MDLAFTSEERQFADDVRAFARANLPADVRDKVKNAKHLGRDDYMRWQQALGKQGWLVYTWPKKHGGPGFTPAERYIFENICAEENAPGIVRFGTKMVGPVIIRSAPRRRRPEIPASRSASQNGVVVPGLFRTRLGLRPRHRCRRRRARGRLLHPQRLKTWTTDGHWADWIFCLVRADPKRQNRSRASPSS